MKQRPELFRAIALTAAGRTLEGVAFQWDTPSMVRDPGAAPYLEEFARGSADKTITEHPIVPLCVNHDASSPIGVASFHRSAEGLMFSAPVSKTRPGDEYLELVNDGAMTDASVRFASYKDRRRTVPAGIVTTRLEIGIRELSIATTGFGQHPGAKVLAVRADLGDDDTEAGTPRVDDARRRLILLRRVDL